MSKRIFIVGHLSTCFSLAGPYAGPLLCTGNLLGLGQAMAQHINLGPYPHKHYFLNKGIIFNIQKFNLDNIYHLINIIFYLLGYIS